ncbi:MAG: hypothetical protein ACTSO9_14535 [Candidatus Helarchaeota archaeon]
MINTSILNEDYIRNIIDEANQLYSEYDLDKDIIPVALDIIIRYIKHSIPSEPREKNILYAASYFVALRHPFSQPSHITRDSWANKFGIKTTSLDWYINRVLTELDFIRVHDERMLPYFVDKTSLIYTVTLSITHSQLSESLINSIIENRIPDVNIIVDKIVSMLIDRLRILPNVFRRSLTNIVLEIVRKETKDLRI